MATWPTEKVVSRIVAKRKPHGAPTPLPEPTAYGVLPIMAVSAVAAERAAKSTPASPMAPGFSS